MTTLIRFNCPYGIVNHFEWVHLYELRAHHRHGYFKNETCLHYHHCFEKRGLQDPFLQS